MKSAKAANKRARGWVDDEYGSTAYAAFRLRDDRKTVYRECVRGNVPAIRVMRGRRPVFLIPKSWIEAEVARRREAAEAVKPRKREEIARGAR